MTGSLDSDVINSEDYSGRDSAGGFSDDEICNGAGTAGVRQGAGAGGDEVVRLDAGNDDDATNEGENCDISSSARIRSVNESIDVADEEYDWCAL